MIVLGIDMSKDMLAVALWQQDHAGVLAPVPNPPAGWDQALATLQTRLSPDELASVSVVLEPTGGSELGVALWASQRGWPVSRPNPRHVRDWAKSQGRRAKTDAQDAMVLAQDGAQGQPPLWHPLPQEVSELATRLRRRDDLRGLLQQERNRQQQVAARPGMHREVPQSVERLIGVLEEELAQIEPAIADHLRQHAELQQTRDRLLTVPGVGAKNVLPVLVLLYRWQVRTDGPGSSKGLVAYAGLDPQPYASGTSVHRPAAISRLGERTVRSQLYMGALGALRGANPAHAFSQRLVDRGKAKKLALVAAARQILTWAWAVFHTGTPFDAAKAGA